MQLRQAVCSCVQGQVKPEAAAHVAGKLYALGCYEVSMGDTIGIGTPASVAAMFEVSTKAALEHQRVLFCWGSVPLVFAMLLHRPASAQHARLMLFAN